MKDRKDWTEGLPPRLADYTEPEPEGLWEAVRAEVGDRRRTSPSWWYAAGALAAAAAVTLFVVFKPFGPKEPAAVVPDRDLAEVSVREENESHAPVVPEAEGSVVGAMLAQAQPSLSSEAGIQVKARPAQANVPQTEVAAGSGVQVEATPQPAAESPSPAAGEPVEQVREQDTPGMPSREKSADPSQPSGITDSSHPSETADPSRPTPAAAPARSSRPSRSGSFPVRVQLGVTTTGLLAQAGPQTVRGMTPLSVLPSTRSISTGYDISGLEMAGRNKAAETEVLHRQSARFGAGIRVQFLPRWGVESGLVGTRLHSSSESRSGAAVFVKDREYTYWGVPLYLHYNALERRPFSLYLAAGPMIEFSRSYKEISSTTFNGKQLSSASNSFAVKDTRFSLNLGAGVQWAFFEHNALFVQPGISFYPPRTDALDNYYSAHPVSFQVTLGYRLIIF